MLEQKWRIPGACGVGRAFILPPASLRPRYYSYASPVTARSETELGYSARVWPGSEHEPRKSRKRKDGTSARTRSRFLFVAACGWCTGACATPQRQRPSALPSLHASACPSCHCHPWRLARRVATASASGSARTHARISVRPVRTHRGVRALSSGLSLRRCRVGVAEEKQTSGSVWFKSFPARLRPDFYSIVRSGMTLACKSSFFG